jgi:hypothetical protein
MAGGGAGGSGLLDIPAINAATILEAKGGCGTDHQSIGDTKHGPGGSFIAVRQAAASINFTITPAGGLNGVNTNFGNDPHGATPGNDGTSYVDFDVIKATQPFKPNIDSVRINKTVPILTSMALAM